MHRVRGRGLDDHPRVRVVLKDERRALGEEGVGGGGRREVVWVGGKVSNREGAVLLCVAEAPPP